MKVRIINKEGKVQDFDSINLAWLHIRKDRLGNFFEEIIDGEKVRVYDERRDPKEDRVELEFDEKEVLRMIQDDPTRKWARWVKYIFSAIIIWPFHLLLMPFVLVFSIIKGLIRVKK
jgi:hypothetical protein